MTELNIIVFDGRGCTNSPPPDLANLWSQVDAPSTVRVHWWEAGADMLRRLADENETHSASWAGPGAGPRELQSPAARQSRWLTFVDWANAPDAKQIANLLAAIRLEQAAHAALVTCGPHSTAASPTIVPSSSLAAAPPGWRASAVRVESLVAAGEGLQAGPDPAALDSLIWRVLLQPSAQVLFAATSAGKDERHPEPWPARWRDLSTYGSTLRAALLRPLQTAAAVGTVPTWLQRAVLEHLHWYFTVDARERSPTVSVDLETATTFHTLVRDVMQHITPVLLDGMDPSIASSEVRHALLSYRSPVLTSAPTADAYDHDQCLLRITYWTHGPEPAERFCIDGRTVEPAHGKRRACKFFHRTLMRQRIAWLDVSRGSTLGLELDGRPVRIRLGSAPFHSGPCANEDKATLSVAQAQAGFGPGRAGWQGDSKPRPPRWRARVLPLLSRLPPWSHRYRDAWIFVDRDHAADDSAEHLYRWVQANRPEINAWYLLRPESPDWSRLQRDGFQLMPPGLRRRLLYLNARHVVLSHTEHSSGGFDPAAYGAVMRWRVTFLPHGPNQNDLSHWLNGQAIDCFVATNPEEYRSVVGDSSAYRYTTREVADAGLPRHDRLLEMAAATAAQSSNLLLIMPTWRASLFDGQSADASAAQRLDKVRQSEFGRAWRAVVNSPALHAMAQRAGLRVGFLAHANLVPVIDALDLPRQVQVFRAGIDLFQPLACQTRIFLTDYTSAAFELALLRRAVFYYQFDRERFYRGDHNWRPGYFDYDRDGFGPVAFDLEQLLGQLASFVDSGQVIDTTFQQRMERALPVRDRQACQRTFDAIVERQGLHRRTPS
jgi:CDP-Glycerol:Poly(glycerophosphate) glycerophosphotransferase